MCESDIKRNAKLKLVVPLLVGVNTNIEVLAYY